MSKLMSVNCNPEIDGYHRDTNTPTKTCFFIDLETGQYGISQEMDDNATPEPEWNGRTQTAYPANRPDETEAKNYLVSPECLVLLQRVLDGGSIDLDRNQSNMVGSLDDDAQDAFEKIVSDLENLTGNEFSLWTAHEWFGQTTVSDLGITRTTADDEIEIIATRLEADARLDNAIITDSISVYLTDLRNEIKASVEEA